MNYQEAIYNRISVRSYKEKNIPEKTLQALELFIKDEKNLIGPFGNKIELMLIRKSQLKKTKTFGTYGVIKGAEYYLTGIIKNTTEELVDFGFVMEKAVLFLTSLGMGTCWLGGTFKRSVLLDELSLESDDIIPAIVPFGYSRDKRSFIDKSMRYLAKSNKRHTWHDLYFNKTFSYHLAIDKEADYYLPLEMVRIAPSASNKQPWRVLREGNDYHFYKSGHEFYTKSMSFDMQMIDMGIAMSHFELVNIEQNTKGKWSNHYHNDFRKYQYVLTWSYELS